MLKDHLISICKQHILTESDNVVVKEPYFPFIPNNWNRILVLAESQNLSDTNSYYVNTLLGNDENWRCDRLNKRFPIDGIVGVYPWDDGSIKIAIEAALGVDASQVAVSNAVLWSQRGSSEQNITPEISLQKRSVVLWKEMLEVLNPEKIVCCGKIAANVIEETGINAKVLKWRLPAKTAMSRVSGMFKMNDLLRRFPEVKNTFDRHPEWFEGNYRLNKVFFACHAVSMCQADEV